MKKNPHAVALGRLGGKARAESIAPEEASKIGRKAGKASAASKTSAQRSELARKAVMARWAKCKKEPQ